MSNIFLLFITLYSLLITNLISCVAHLTFHLSLLTFHFSPFTLFDDNLIDKQEACVLAAVGLVADVAGTGFALPAEGLERG